MSDNVTLLPTKPNELAVHVANFKENLRYLIEYEQLKAKQKWAQYNALVKEGFSPEQALFLVKG
jgi:hypothetical protein